ncbi:MAG: hypothetical protein EOM67_15285, partial [Spirochaetia bacterium]|nr:hypothetical protein [Spirochaetia bacterium]
CDVMLMVQLRGKQLQSLIGHRSSGQPLEDALANGCGAILISPHFGNWEIGAPYFDKYGKEMKVVMVDEEYQKIKQILDSQKRVRSFDVISVEEGSLSHIFEIRDALDKIKNSMHVDKDLIKEVIKEIQRALISSDVNIQLVLNISKEIEEKAFEEIPSGITRKEHIVRLCYETLLKYIGGEVKTQLPENPESILLCGLFGSGKTTTAAKLAKFYKKRGLKVGLICADTFRPAAYEQLKQLSEMVGVAFYGNPKETSAFKVTKEGLNLHKKNGCNLIIVDSAGRSALDDELVTEIKEIDNVFNPKFSFLVISADIGQAVKDQATAFNNAIGVNGVIITKLDGSAKGGGALTACYITKSPIYFIGTGEKADDFEIFDSNRYLSRVLGFGDLESLMEKITEATTEEEMEKMKDLNPEDILKGNVTFGLFKQQLEFSKKLGPLTKVMGFLGVGNKISTEQQNLGEKKMTKYRAILSS